MRGARSLLRLARCALGACCATLLLGGCLGGDEPEEELLPVVDPLPSDSHLQLRAIQVDNETDSGNVLEVEVHVLDATTGAFLGCSGNLQGLVNVDQSNLRYNVDAHFVKPGGLVGYPAPRSEWLTRKDVEGKTLKLVVIEDDLSACPTPADPEDDVLGTSVSLAAASLGAPAPVAMASGEVPVLLFGVE